MPEAKTDLPSENLLTSMLAERDWLLADGATGTSMMGRGLPHGYPPELWNLEEPEKIKEHYRSFIDAGSDIVLTNTFGGTSHRLKLHDAQDKVYEINKAAAELLREEIEASGRKIIAAGSMGPTGELYEPSGPLTVEAGKEAYMEQIRGLKDGGVDVCWFETLYAEEELRAALEAAAELDMPATFTMSFDMNGRTMMGLTPSHCLNFAQSTTPRPIGLGGNCGTGASDLLAGLISLQGGLKDDDILIAKANCGVPEWKGDAVHYNGTPELMADYARMARNAGARIIGGCCGTTPEHVSAMREALEAHTKEDCPTLEQVIDVIGPLTGNTENLVAGHGAPAPERQRRGRRRASSE